MNKFFGLEAAWKNYGWRNFGKDSVLPILVSLILVFCVCKSNGDIYLQLKLLIEIGLEIVPTMVALILTAYTLILTFIISGGFSLVRSTNKGKELVRNLNSSFAICLIISTISIIVMIVVSCIASIEIRVQNSDMINYPTFFIVCYLLVFSVYILIGIVIDVFNSGQTTLLDDGKND